ncbi:MAG: hypothetical protein HZB66_00895 [Candidatus Aenigmarchaeota archaeon]|nr:hypothetical protein [Candidatus Aenigmarchaeota archaeon]
MAKKKGFEESKPKKPTVLEFEDTANAPAEWITINYKGKNPVLVYTVVPRAIVDILKISSANLFEDHIKWDFTGDNKMFYGIWRGRDNNDRWTDTWVRVVIQGVMEPDKTGWVTVYIKATIKTKYTYANFIQRNLWWIFNRWFYYKARRAYLDLAKDRAYMIRDEIRAALGILPEE